MGFLLFYVYMHEKNSESKKILLENILTNIKRGDIIKNRKEKIVAIKAAIYSAEKHKNNKFVVKKKRSESMEKIIFSFFVDRVDIPQAASQGSPEGEGFN